jgi:RNA polymerase sigma-70 factor (ECF subfamily)
MERTDELLMEAYRDGDETVFPDLVRRYQGLLFGYLMRMVHNREIAEDLFQETFLRVHEKAHTYRPGAKFKSWIFTIATRIAIDRLRCNQRRPELRMMESEERIEDTASNPAEETIRLELRRTVQDAIEVLPPKQRAVLILSYYQRHTYPEIAEIMSCSTGAIKTHMSRALKKLSAVLPKPEGGLQ